MDAARLSCVLLALSLTGCDDGAAPQDGPLDGALSPRDAASGSDASARDTGTRDADARPLDAAMDTGVPNVGEAGQDAERQRARSAGCGNSANATEGFETRTLRVAERERSYALLVPAGYQATRAYPLIFRFHGSGGNGKSGGLDIQNESDDGALVVAPDGLNQDWTGGSEAADLALFDGLLEDLSALYCVDLDRVYAYGFSAGAGFSELLACKRGDRLRAIAAIAGWDSTGSAKCSRPVAAWLAHDQDDDAVSIDMGRQGRDQLLELSGCSKQTAPAGQDCVRYQGCAAGAPVVWCETQGLGHNIRGDYAPAEVWKFFGSL
jgi:polyhydroxybutyrate depolymerase